MNETEKSEKRSVYAGLGIFIIAGAVLAIVGFLMLRPADDYYQGQVEATSVRVSGKLPGRVAELYVEEGDKVHSGDTIAKIYSSTADAKLMQAEAMQSAAQSQREKADAGARSQVITAAQSLWQQTMAAEEIHRKTYERVEKLFKQEVVSEQKRDEALAAYNAARAAARAAKSQYDMAVEGAQREDRASAASMERAAQGTVAEVMSMLEDSYLVAPCDGEITSVYPEIGELVGTGAPIAEITRLDEAWITFNVREESLADLPMGTVVDVMVPALNELQTSAQVYYVRDMGSYAVWAATKSIGQYDSKTFRIKMRPVKPIENLRPGMSVIMKK